MKRLVVKPQIEGLRGAARQAHLNRVRSQVRELIESVKPTNVVSLTSIEGAEMERRRRLNPPCPECQTSTPVSELKANDGLCYDCRERQLQQDKQKKAAKKSEQKAAYQKRQALLAEVLEANGGKLPKVKLTSQQFAELQSIKAEHGEKRAKKSYEDIVLAVFEAKQFEAAKQVNYQVVGCKACRYATHVSFMQRDHPQYCKYCVIPTKVSEKAAEQVQPVSTEPACSGCGKDVDLDTIVENGIPHIICRDSLDCLVLSIEKVEKQKVAEKAQGQADKLSQANRPLTRRESQRQKRLAEKAKPKVAEATSEGRKKKKKDEDEPKKGKSASAGRNGR